MKNKIMIILERARDGIEPLEDLEQEILNLHLVMCEFIERQRKELNIDDNVEIFLTAEENGDGVDIHIEDKNNYPKFVKTIKHNYA